MIARTLLGILLVVLGVGCVIIAPFDSDDDVLLAITTAIVGAVVILIGAMLIVP